MDKKNLIFKCDFCEKSFFNEQILGLHIKTVHSSIITGLKKCEVCQNTLSNVYSLREHLKTIHMNDLIKNIQM